MKDTNLIQEEPMKKAGIYSRFCALVIVSLCCASVFAQVRDVPASEIKQVVAAQTPALVLFTSPDKDAHSLPTENHE
ncbi:MAG: hypothetical protein ACKOF9_04195 [Burkholderiales bacterium]